MTSEDSTVTPVFTIGNIVVEILTAVAKNEGLQRVSELRGVCKLFDKCGFDAIINANLEICISITGDKLPDERKIFLATRLPISLKWWICSYTSRNFDMIAKFLKNAVSVDLKISRFSDCKDLEGDSYGDSEKFNHLRRISYQPCFQTHDDFDKIIDLILQRTNIEKLEAFTLQLYYWSKMTDDCFLVSDQVMDYVTNINIHINYDFLEVAIPKLRNIPKLKHVALKIKYGYNWDDELTFDYSKLKSIYKKIDNNEGRLIKSIDIDINRDFALPSKLEFGDGYQFNFLVTPPVVLSLKIISIGAIDRQGIFTYKNVGMQLVPLNKLFPELRDLCIASFCFETQSWDSMNKFLCIGRQNYQHLKILSLYGMDRPNEALQVLRITSLFPLMGSMEEFNLECLTATSFCLIFPEVCTYLLSLKKITFTIYWENDDDDDFDIVKAFTGIRKSDIPENTEQWKSLLESDMENEDSIKYLKELETLDITMLLGSRPNPFSIHPFLLAGLLYAPKLKTLRLDGDFIIPMDAKTYWKSLGKNLIYGEEYFNGV